MLARQKIFEAPHGAMSYNLKNIIIPKTGYSVRGIWTNCFGSIEAFVFGSSNIESAAAGLLNQEYISADDQNIVP